MLDLSADVGSSDTGSFTVISDVRTHYTASESASWLSIVSGRRGNVGPGRTKTVTVQGTCSVEGNFSTDVTIDPRSGEGDVVTVNLECIGEEHPPPLRPLRLPPAVSSAAAATCRSRTVAAPAPSAATGRRRSSATS